MGKFLRKSHKNKWRSRYWIPEPEPEALIHKKKRLSTKFEKTLEFIFDTNPVYYDNDAV